MSKSIQLREKIIRRLMELDEYDLEKINLAVKAVENSKKNELHYFGHLLGIQFTNRPNKAEMLLSSNIWNSFGVVQGGALYSFADISMGFYIKHLLGEKFNIVTLELKMNYIKPGQGKKMICISEVLHLGKSTVVSEAKIEDDEAELVAVAFGTFYVKRK